MRLTANTPINECGSVSVERQKCVKNVNSYHVRSGMTWLISKINDTTNTLTMRYLCGCLCNTFAFERSALRRESWPPFMHIYFYFVSIAFSVYWLPFALSVLFRFCFFFDLICLDYFIKKEFTHIWVLRHILSLCSHIIWSTCRCSNFNHPQTRLCDEREWNEAEKSTSTLFVSSLLCINTNTYMRRMEKFN